MKPVTHRDADPVESFLRLLRFRHVTSGRSYASILRGFQRFALTHAGGEPLTVEVVQRWLNDRIPRHGRIPRLPMRDVCHHARLVDRFLEWMKSRGDLPNNPFAELRQQYGHRTAPIVRALLSDDPAAALLRLRPPPAMTPERYASLPQVSAGQAPRAPPATFAKALGPAGRLVMVAAFSYQADTLR